MDELAQMLALPLFMENISNWKVLLSPVTLRSETHKGYKEMSKKDRKAAKQK